MKISISHWFKSQDCQVLSAEYSARDLLNISMFRMLEKFENKVASFMASVYIKHHRKRLEEMLFHPTMQKRINREITKLFKKRLDGFE